MVGDIVLQTTPWLVMFGIVLVLVVRHHRLSRAHHELLRRLETIERRSAGRP